MCVCACVCVVLSKWLEIPHRVGLTAYKNEDNLYYVIVLHENISLLLLVQLPACSVEFWESQSSRGGGEGGAPPL